MLAGLCLAGSLVVTLLVAAFGTDVAATVTKTRTSQSSKGGTVYYIYYRYSAGGREYTNSQTVGANAYTPVSHPEDPGGRAATVRVRHFALGPLHYQLLPQEESPWKLAGVQLFAVLFWNGILSVFVYWAWVVPIRQRLLVRHGHATAGTIVHTRVRRGKSTTYYATFRFTDPANGREVKAEMALPGKDQYDAAHAGRVVTVLYDPRNPRRALVYELCAYEAAGAQPI
jgi:hypothetical protein